MKNHLRNGYRHSRKRSLIIMVYRQWIWLAFRHNADHYCFSAGIGNGNIIWRFDCCKLDFK